LYATLVASVFYGYRFVIERAWVGLAVCVLGASAVIFMLYRRPPRPKGIEAPRMQFPRLAAALTEVSQRVGAPVPHRVILTPHAEAFVYPHRPLRRFFRRELVLGLGMGALPLLAEVDLKTILAHELAHYRHGDPTQHRYFSGAENALARLIDILRIDDSPSRRIMRSGRSRGSVTDGIMLAELVMGLVMLPIRAIWMLFHLLRLRESRMAEFAADRIAARSYGALSFINGLTGLAMAADTLRGAGRSFVGEMRKHGGTNLYAELRHHYAALPPTLICQLRVKAAPDFRALERTHPSTPDRLRAVYGMGILPPGEPYRPSIELLVPAGATSADAVEAELTNLWLK
jgi:Zn-dependent protease with chaperone function